MALEQYIGYVLLIVAVFSIYMAVVALLRKDRTLVRAEKIVAERAAQQPEEPADSQLLELVEKIVLLFGINIHQQRDITVSLSKAGFNTRSALIYYLFFERIVQPILLVVGCFFLLKLLVLSDTKPSDNLAPIMEAAMLVFAGLRGTKLFLENCTQKNQKAMLRSFPEALDLMLICVESGLGIDAAFGRVCKEIKETHPIIAAEFERTRFEMTMMSDRVQALQNFADRTGLAPVRSLVASLTQAERFGTSLVDTMRTIAEDQRTERMLDAESKAARLPALITLPLMLFILPSLFMVILGPVFIKIAAQGGLFGPGR